MLIREKWLQVKLTLINLNLYRPFTLLNKSSTNKVKKIGDLLYGFRVEDRAHIFPK